MLVDRTPACRALIVHPRFPHSSLRYLLDKSLAPERVVAVAGHPGPPFRVEQHFESSSQHLGSVLWAAGLALAAHVSQNAEEMRCAAWAARESSKGEGGGGQQRPGGCCERLGGGGGGGGGSGCDAVRVLELGCGGAAIVAQCAALRGMRVVATDLPEVLGWAARNVELNRPEQQPWGAVGAVGVVGAVGAVGAVRAAAWTSRLPPPRG